MFEEGFKRFDNVTIISVLDSKNSKDGDGTISFKTEDGQSRFAKIRQTYLESYKKPIDAGGEPQDFISDKGDALEDETMMLLVDALKYGKKLNLVISIIKNGHNVEFLTRVETV